MSIAQVTILLHCPQVTKLGDLRAMQQGVLLALAELKRQQVLSCPASDLQWPI